MKLSRIFLQSSLVIASFFLSGVANAQPGAFALDDYSGAEIFQRFCASCHGESARGDGPVASTLAVLVPDLTQLTRRYGNRFPAEDLREVIDGRALVISHGARSMPVWGYEFWWEEGADVEAEAASRRVIDRLLDYLLSIQSTP